MKIRSLLYVPASAQKFIANAHTRGADAIILDMEDAVSPRHKEKARADLIASIASVGQSGARVFVRINSDTETAQKDAEVAHAGGAFGLYVSKASVKKLRDIDHFLNDLEKNQPSNPMHLVALIEDPAGVLAAREMAPLPRMFALSIGSEDLATSLGAEPSPFVLTFPKQLVHYAAKGENLMSFGLFRTVADYSDLEAIKTAAKEAKSHGFDGASCVHPSAVAILNSAFMPTKKEIEWAQKIVDVASNTLEGAFSIEGNMIDAPVIARAKTILKDKF